MTWQRPRPAIASNGAHKYRFGCRFADGSTFVAPEDDLHPLVPGRNAFYELLQKDVAGNPIMADDGMLLPRPDIVEFWAEGQGVHCAVDLKSGRFKLNGAALITDVLPPAGGIPMLLWFRRHQVHQNADLRTGKTIGPTTESPVQYHMGWRCYVDGRKHEQTVVLT